MLTVSSLLRLAAVLAAATLASIPVSAGERISDFSLIDQDGNLHQLHDYEGKNLVIYFFPKADTPG